MMSIMITVHIIRSSFRGRDDYPLWWDTSVSLELIQTIVIYFAYVSNDMLGSDTVFCRIRGRTSAVTQMEHVWMCPCSYSQG